MLPSRGTVHRPARPGRDRSSTLRGVRILASMIGGLVGWTASVAGHAALAVGSVALTLVAFEVAAREFAPGWAPPAGDRKFWVFDRALGWHHRPNQTGEHVHRDFRVAVEIGPHGLRDQSYPKMRTAGRPRMLVLGDSFGWGHGVAADEIASERLETRRPLWRSSTRR